MANVHSPFAVRSLDSLRSLGMIKACGMAAHLDQLTWWQLRANNL
jgi:hypothetical protein